MTWFLKSKLKKQLALVKSLNNQLVEAMNKYNNLVNEFVGQNNFQPIILQQPETESPQEVQQQTQAAGVKKIVTKGKKSNPEVMEL